ncbi:EcsC family protein [Paraclostridium bifermentans]|uniref:EcsC family protein n=1 Tax=Paraclostridium bifermentans TaxID=1490 RepID=UPI00241CB92E|nr:EcsC family protein [Paraclostridium bifermentans]
MDLSIAKITPEKMVEVLDSVYTQVLTGLPGQKSIYDLADDYKYRYESTEQAISKLIRSQVAKATVTGAVTGLGGLISLPIALPADLVGSLGIQLRMIGAIAVLRGYDPSDDQVKTLAYACLVGSGATDLLKGAGLKIGVKMTEKLVQKIPGKVLIKINQKVGFRLVTKGGSKGIINLGKMVPFIGAPIGGGFNFVETSGIAEAAKIVFV